MIDYASAKAFVRNRFELGAALAVLCAILSIWAFVAIAGEVMEGDSEAIDRAVFTLFHDASDPAQPVGPPQLNVFARDLTALGGTGILIMVTTFSALYLTFQNKWRTGAVIVTAVLSGFAASQLLKWGFAIPRPELAPHGTYVSSMSFPSGHAMMSAATYLTLALLTARVEKRRSLRIFLVSAALVLVVLVGVSRVYLAVHWPSDVLGGWTLGTAWAIAWWFVARFVEQSSASRKTPDNERRRWPAGRVPSRPKGLLSGPSRTSKVRGPADAKPSDVGDDRP